MIESGESIKQLELGIGRRLQLLAVQDLIALSGLVSAGFGLIALLLLGIGPFEIRIAGGIGTGGSLVLCGIPLAAAGGLVGLRHFLRKRGRWRSNLEADADQSDFIIDRALDLDDRVQTAGSIIRRGGPANIMESALVEDAASRLAGAGPERFVRYCPPRLDSAVRCYTSVACSIVLALIVLVVLIQYRLATYAGPGADSETIAVMRAAGDDLEKSTEAIEQSVRSETPTAALARQQAELARALKESATHEGRSRNRPIGRAQALKDLSAIEEKLGSRKNELESTRASEILSLAERRLQSALSGTTSLRHDQVAQHHGTSKAEVDGKKSKVNKPGSTDDQSTDDRGPASKSAPQDRPAIADNRGAGDARSPAERQGPAGKEAVGDKAADGLSSERKRSIADNGRASDNPAGANHSRERSSESNASDRKGNGVSPDDSKPGDRQPSGALAENKDQTEAVPPQKEPPPDSVTGMLPNLSGELIKKAADMRANHLTPADIEQFRKAAEGLLKDLSAKDLANLANSKEIRQTLEQLARQVNPQQMEQLARQLLNQKEIRDELQAVGKLLMENRQAKETIAGFADKAREIARQFQQQRYNPQAPPEGFGPPPGMTPQGNESVSTKPGSGSGGQRRNYGRIGTGAEPLTSAGSGAGRSGESARRVAKLENKSDSSPEGEPIYARSRPGSAPSRVPYSAAYPGYRREAERSVERSEVPFRLRGMIRTYFDAINPDAERRP